MTGRSIAHHRKAASPIVIHYTLDILILVNSLQQFNNCLNLTDPFIALSIPSSFPPFPTFKMDRSLDEIIAEDTVSFNISASIPCCSG